MITATGRNELSVGVGILDCDHREMDEAFKELRGEIATGWKHSEAGYLLQRLAQFTLIHFALEEGMMEATKYPMAARHRTNHRRLMQQINELVSRYREEGLIPDEQWLSLLPASHHAHVENDDLNYGHWLNER